MGNTAASHRAQPQYAILYEKGISPASYVFVYQYNMAERCLGCLTDMLVLSTPGELIMQEVNKHTNMLLNNTGILFWFSACIMHAVCIRWGVEMHI